jgi:hypothetical protein
VTCCRPTSLSLTSCRCLLAACAAVTTCPALEKEQGRGGTSGAKRKAPETYDMNTQVVVSFADSKGADGAAATGAAQPGGGAPAAAGAVGGNVHAAAAAAAARGGAAAAPAAGSVPPWMARSTAAAQQQKVRLCLQRGRVSGCRSAYTIAVVQYDPCWTWLGAACRLGKVFSKAAGTWVLLSCAAFNVTPPCACLCVCLCVCLYACLLVCCTTRPRRRPSRPG